MAKKFGSAGAFKSALEAQLRMRSEQSGRPFSHYQTKFVLERFLARLFWNPRSPWLLKGGYAMDLRYRPQARTTKDVDLAVPLANADKSAISVANLRGHIQESVDFDPGDFLSFRIGEMRKEITNAPGGGTRFSCDAILLGKVYQRFSLDVSFGDFDFGKPERLVGEDFLDFAGLDPAIVFAIPKAQQFAEKIHAYSFPWQGRINTRTKDLVDMVLLIERANLDLDEVRDALRGTFGSRQSHPLPDVPPSPPQAWAIDFPGMAEEANLSTTDYLVGYAILNEYWSAHSLGKLPVF